MTKLETYQHHKGGLYIKLYEALHTETNETLVIYACAVRGGIYARPKEMFYETIEEDGYVGPRFKPMPELDKEGAREFLKKGCKI